jgi:hypothetical protein
MGYAGKFNPSLMSSIPSHSSDGQMAMRILYLCKYNNICEKKNQEDKYIPFYSFNQVRGVTSAVMVSSGTLKDSMVPRDRARPATVTPMSIQMPSGIVTGRPETASSAFITLPEHFVNSVYQVIFLSTILLLLDPP